jgi:hypothetical protein
MGAAHVTPDEVEIVGGWVFDGARAHADPASERIEHLVAKVLVRLASSEASGGWETLYRDPTDGRFWESTYPQSHMHGGGPPRLAVIAADAAKRKYGVP